jgi:hypothetical protein
MEPASASRPEMVHIPGDFDFAVSGIEIEGYDDEGTDVQYLWEGLPEASIQHFMQVSMSGHAMLCALHSSNGRPANLDFLKATSLSFGNAHPDKQRRHYTDERVYQKCTRRS